MSKLFYNRFALLFLIAILIICFSAPIESNAQIIESDSQSYLPLITNGQPDVIQTYLNQVDSTHITDMTRDLVEQYGPRHQDFDRIFVDNYCSLGSDTWLNHNLIRSSKYVFHYFEDLGYSPYKEWVYDEWGEDWFGSYNVIAQITGSVYPDVFIEVAAHIDTKDTTPGASDNAAAVAAVMEIARVLVDYPSRYSLRFVTFVGEEYNQYGGRGYSLVGSRHHASQLLADGDSIKAGLVMDGIGWSENTPVHMNCLWDNGDSETRRISLLFEEARDTYNIDIGWRLCTADGQTSDNYAYWERGFPAVLSIGGLPYVEPNYHQCGDSMNSVDMVNAYKTALENLAVLLLLDAEDYSPETVPLILPDPSLRDAPSH